MIGIILTFEAYKLSISRVAKSVKSDEVQTITLTI